MIFTVRAGGFGDSNGSYGNERTVFFIRSVKNRKMAFFIFIYKLFLAWALLKNGFNLMLNKIQIFTVILKHFTEHYLE